MLYRPAPHDAHQLGDADRARVANGLQLVMRQFHRDEVFVALLDVPQEFLLKSLENSEEHERMEGRAWFDVSKLKAELGVDY